LNPNQVAVVNLVPVFEPAFVAPRPDAGG
jgi:hypothetical protein